MLYRLQAGCQANLFRIKLLCCESSFNHEGDLESTSTMGTEGAAGWITGHSWSLCWFKEVHQTCLRNLPFYTIPHPPAVLGRPPPHLLLSGPSPPHLLLKDSRDGVLLILCCRKASSFFTVKGSPSNFRSSGNTATTELISLPRPGNPNHRSCPFHCLVK